MRLKTHIVWSCREIRDAEFSKEEIFVSINDCSSTSNGNPLSYSPNWTSMHSTISILCFQLNPMKEVHYQDGRQKIATGLYTARDLSTNWNIWKRKQARLMMNSKKPTQNNHHCHLQTTDSQIYEPKTSYYTGCTMKTRNFLTISYCGSHISSILSVYPV